MDIALELGPIGEYLADLAIKDDDVAGDEGLRTAVLLSLFLDRRAAPDDSLPADDGNLRGWWGDELAEVPGDRIGSRLWLIDRAKRLADVAPVAEQYVREALAWMIEDGITPQIDVAASADRAALVLTIAIHRPSGGDPVTFRFRHLWDGEVARAV